MGEPTPSVYLEETFVQNMRWGQADSYQTKMLS